MPKLSKRGYSSVLLLLAIVALVALAYLQYVEQRDAFQRSIEGVNFELTSAGTGYTDVSAVVYTDVVAVRIPLVAENSGQRSVRLEEARFRISLEGKTLEERSLRGVEITAGGSREILLERVKLDTMLLDEILASKNIDAAHPEESTLALTIDVLLPYTVKIFGFELWRAEIPVAISGDVLVRSFMGGKTQEEAALGFLPRNSSRNP